MSKMKLRLAIRKKYQHWQDTEHDDLSHLDMFAQHLESELSDQVAARTAIDSRFITALRLFNGVYSDKELDAMKGRSKAYMNHLRQKCNAGEAQIAETSIPTSGKAWGISPTPIPDLEAKLNSDKAAFVDGQPVQIQGEDGETTQATEKVLVAREQQIAVERCAKMESLIDDQLIECGATRVWRRGIQDGVRYGTCVFKGPYLKQKPHWGYDQQHQPVRKVKETLAFHGVKPWDFYPDMTATCIEDARFFFERDYSSKTELQNWAIDSNKPYVLAATRRLLGLYKDGRASQHNTEMLDSIRALTGSTSKLDDDRYELWTYTGPIPDAVLDEFYALTGPVNTIERDPLTPSPEVEIIYCNGIVLDIQPLLFPRDQAQPYQVWNWEEDDTCIFGYGIMDLGGDAQAVFNAAWRMMIDNASLSAIPMIGFVDGKAEPLDGKFEVKAGKPWRMKAGTKSLKEVFDTFSVESRLNENASFMQLAKQQVDEVVGLPMLQQGEQGPANQTLGGMSMLMNAANTVRRNQVMDWDDNIIKPLISGFYHYNMMYHPDPSVKGDQQVNAKGVSALLQREIQAQNIINLMNMAQNSPVLGAIVQIKAVEWLREWCRVSNIDDSLLPTENELAELAKQQAESQDQPPSEAQEKAELLNLEYSLKQQQSQQEHQFKMQLAQVDREIEIMRLAQQEKLTLEQIQAKLKEVSIKETSHTNRFNAEVALKNQGERTNIGLETS